jgi:threonine/homoserine/homoserine lactone efflux protein
MPLPTVLRGFLIGLAIAAPVGPIGLLCIRRTLDEGRAAGFVSGLGAATADALYGSIAAFGLTAISGVLIASQAWLRLLGGLFLGYLGVRTFLAPVSQKPAETRGSGLAGAYASTFVLTLTNPMTILSFAGIFAGLGVAPGGYSQAGLLVLGVFTGSTTWWLGLSVAFGLLQKRIVPAALRWVNRLAGALIAGFGVLALIGLLPAGGP